MSYYQRSSRTLHATPSAGAHPWLIAHEYGHHIFAESHPTYQIGRKQVVRD